jgi:CP family cyanate transporter-like MFS transporter
VPDQPAQVRFAPARTPKHAWPLALFVLGIIALAFNLRIAVTSLPPLFPELAGRLHLSPAELSALAATPVLCFGVFSLAAAPLSRRFGEERVLLAALVLLTAGLVMRGLLPGWLLFPGTVAAGAAIALMNVLLPSLVKRRQPARAGWLLGIYLLSLSAGAVLGSLVAVPAYRATGGSVLLAVGMWSVPAAVAVFAWLPQSRFRTLPATADPATADPGRAGPDRPAGRQPGRRRLVQVWRYPLAWKVLFFMGLQSLTYYSALSWLPLLLRDRGTSAATAGGLLALMNFGNTLTALFVPVLAHRTRDHRALVTVTVAVSMAGLAGSWLAPVSFAIGWVLLLGLGQGAALSLALYFTMARTRDPVTAASLSAFAQGGGYLLAAAGPLLIGLLHSVTGNWTAPMLTLLAIFCVQQAAGWGAGRDQLLPRR